MPGGRGEMRPDQASAEHDYLQLAAGAIRCRARSGRWLARRLGARLLLTPLIGARRIGLLLVLMARRAQQRQARQLPLGEHVGGAWAGRHSRQDQLSGLARAECRRDCCVGRQA